MSAEEPGLLGAHGEAGGEEKKCDAADEEPQ
jgi:hypothetical protein